ncbi:MAG: alpha-hydroxy acid oxidase [Phycisphaerales bacterium]
MAQRVDAPHVVNIDDLRLAARRRLPRMAFDYVDGGAEREATLRANCSAFEEVRFLPRCAVATPTCDLSTKVIGQRLNVPILLAPVGSSRMMWPRGEEAVARAASKAGLLYILSTLAGCRLEDVKAATTSPMWYQLYLLGGRDIASAALARAKAAGYSALVVTIDTPVAGLRERDVRNGVTQMLARNFASVPYLMQMLWKPGWLIDFLRDGGLMSFPNILLPSGPMPYADVTAALERAMVSWSDFAWIRQVWDGPIVVKGVHTADDALRAADHGAVAIVVSNHGGRQLDGVHATLRALPHIVAAAGDRIEVLMDGGVRSGADIAKALALGARAVLVGRAYVYGLGAAGEAGVSRAIEILRTGLVRTMKLLGCASVAELDRSYVDVPREWDESTRLPS